MSETINTCRDTLFLYNNNLRHRALSKLSNMTDLNDLQFFVQVSRTQSFTQAARRLGVPKSSVSRSIHRLEERLGVRLIERTTRRVALTEAGALYLDHCQRVMEEAEQADLAVGALLAKPRGLLRVGAPVAFARSILGPMLGEFLSLYPEMQLHLEMLHGISSSADQSLDLIVRAGPLEDSAFLVKPLIHIRIATYASPHYLADRELPTHPDDLRQHNCIATSCGGSETTWRLRRGTELHEVRIHPRVSAPDPTINHQLALAGAGIALLAQTAAGADVEQGLLVPLLPGWEPEAVDLYALYPSRLGSSPKVRVFLEFLRKRCADDNCADPAQDRPNNPARIHRNIRNRPERKSQRPAAARGLA